MMKLVCIGLLLALLVFCSGCMGISAPAMPKVQPLNVNIQKNNAQMIGSNNQPTPAPTENATVTTIQTTASKIVFV